MLLLVKLEVYETAFKNANIHFDFANLYYDGYSIHTSFLPKWIRYRARLSRA